MNPPPWVGYEAAPPLARPLKETEERLPYDMHLQGTTLTLRSDYGPDVAFNIDLVRGEGPIGESAQREQRLRTALAKNPAFIEWLRTLPVWPLCLVHAAVPDQGGTDEQPWDRWLLVTRIFEAAWPLLLERAGGGDAEAQIAIPAAARTRFVLLSTPFRCEGKPWRHRLLESYTDLGFRARRAQELWHREFVRHQSKPALGEWDNARVELEARRLVFRHDSTRQALVLGTTGHDEQAAMRHQRMLGRLVARDVLLPRFLIGTSWSLTHSDVNWVRAWIPLIASVVAGGLLAVLVADGAAIDRPATVVQSIAVLAFACYAGVVVKVLMSDEGVAYGLCLRLPAVTTLGLGALLAANATPWTDGVSPVVLMVLGAGTAGYLMVEARGHGVDPGPAFRRALVVFAIGIIHATLVTALLFATVAPAFAENFSISDEWPRAWSTLAFGVLASLGLGVFLQVLWDDRPITYPLGHLEWSDQER